MSKTPGKVTEIADHFHVSRATISYILNDKWAARGISKATAEKVLAYVKEIGFQPNVLGLALRGKTVKEIAVIIPATPLEHHKNAFFNLIGELERRRKSYVVLPVTDEKLPETVQFLKMYRVRKLVVFSVGINAANLDLWEGFFKGIPGTASMLYDFPFPNADVDRLLLPGENAAVGFDRMLARGSVLEFIIGRGYDNLILPKGLFDGLLKKTCKRGWKGTVEFYDCDFGEHQPLSLFRMGELVAERLMPLVSPDVTKAVYVNDDRMAAAMIKQLRSKGVDVPGRIAVVSWDGLPESNYFTPPLTTLVVPHEEMLAQVLRWLSDEKTPRLTMFTPTIREGA